MVHVRVRIPKDMIREIDRWVEEGRFVSRSEAIKSIVAYYKGREQTRKFYQLLLGRSKEAAEKREILLLLEKT